MNICFITCFYKTELWYEISLGIENAENIYWISTSKKWSDWLLSQGVKKSNILVVTKDKIEYENRLIKDFEQNDYNLRLSNIILMDRILREIDGREALDYLKSISNMIYSFIQEKNIQIVFGEATAAHEILTSIICNSIGKKFFNPFTVRIPTNRFAFFEGPFQGKFHEFSNIKAENIQTIDKYANNIVSSVIKQNKKPSYFYKNNERPIINISYIQKILQKVKEVLIESGYDMSVKPLNYHLFVEKKYLRPFRYKKIINSKAFEKADNNDKFILFPLHVQPEASIDVLGYKYSNQEELIKSISRVLPLDTKLYVKEHSNSLGQRNMGFYQRLRKLSNVKMIDPFEDTRSLIKKSILTITVTGTVGLECGILGKNAVTLTQMYFNKLQGVEYLRELDDLVSIIENKDINNPLNKLTPIEFYKYCLIHSFEGLISDTLNNPEVLENENIIKIQSAFNLLLDDLKGKV